ncbi:hypothetical protein L932_03300 [Helicobacter pylori PZ5026]|uniref:hypothetical protein n=1 Tax=Helicobacter pylori TaxID=210 RepID=UPI00038D5EFD|nr:hypothetical protein [Helicobacter pylori]EQD92572.1 hypothetical protein L932_03300 [Helicobacter pylori PZ5026]MBM0604878.1 hypothetical protein [Helicobacter pylori]MBM0612546.1 hypothetical protein [Helicobacter pylori]WQU32029.1 hypothetical protein KVE79_00160 [Helicobacter pylori]
MLLNYDFLELVDEPHNRNTSLTASIDKALADKKLARQNKPRVKIKGGLSLRATLDAFGEELSRLKSEQNTTIKASTIESSNLNSIVNKIKSGLPFGTISAFRPFKEAFIKDFNEKERELLTEAYKSGYKTSQLNKVAKNWNDDPNPIDASYLADAFLREYRTIALKLSTALGKPFVNKFLNPKSETTMRDLMSSKEFVERYRYTQKDNMKRTQQLKRLLDSKRDFIGYIQVIGYWKDNLEDILLPDKETSFFVFVNEPSSTFYLRNHLLLWARQFNQAAICYCQNSVYNNKDRYYVELVCAEPEKFGKVWAKFTGITFSVPKELPHSLTRLKNQVYTFFDKNPEKDNYGIAFKDIVKTQIKATYMPHTIGNLTDTFENEIKGFIKRTQSRLRAYGYPKSFNVDEIENWEQQAIKTREQRKCAISKSYRQSYNHNIKVNNLVKAMRQGKKVSRTLIANTIDTDAGYCFISPTDLATQLGNISPRLSKSIVTAIEQAEGIRLTYALIDKVSYNSLHNILSFIFDIDNPLSDQALNQLVIEVPREALKNVKLPQIKNVLTAQIFDGAYHFRGNDYQFKG